MHARTLTELKYRRTLLVNNNKNTTAIVKKLDRKIRQLESKQ